jgi:hypothetical protein
MSVIAERARALQKATKARLVAAGHKGRRLAAKLATPRHRSA